MEDSAAESSVDDDGEIDLLDNITEDNGDAWNPAGDDEVPDGIQGTLTHISTVTSDYGDREDVPLWEVTEKDGHVWSVRAYHKVLNNQMDKANAEVGDFVALKYFGLKPNKKGDFEYEDYKVAVKHR